MKRYIQASLTEGLVGLWWYYEEESILLACKCDIDQGSVDDEGYIQYMNNGSHLTEWRSTLNDQLPEYADELIPKGYKSLERGRVVYDSINHEYTILCSEEISHQGRVISKIVSDFNLSGCKYKIVVNIHYHVAPLTGNQALDDFEYGIFGG